MRNARGKWKVYRAARYKVGLVSRQPASFCSGLRSNDGKNADSGEVEKSFLDNSQGAGGKKFSFSRYCLRKKIIIMKRGETAASKKIKKKNFSLSNAQHVYLQMFYLTCVWESFSRDALYREEKIIPCTSLIILISGGGGRKIFFRYNDVTCTKYLRIFLIYGNFHFFFFYYCSQFSE